MGRVKKNIVSDGSIILEIYPKHRTIGIVIVTKAVAVLEFRKVTFAIDVAFAFDEAVKRFWIDVEDVFLKGFIKFQRTRFLFTPFKFYLVPGLVGWPSKLGFSRKGDSRS